MRVLWTTTLFTFLAGCGGASRVEVAELPQDIREPYESFEFHCSRCHSLARPLNAHIDTYQHWQAYVARMSRMPGSGISAADGQTILRFLHYYSTQIKGVEFPDDPYRTEAAAEPTPAEAAGEPAAAESTAAETVPEPPPSPAAETVSDPEGVEVTPHEPASEEPS